MEKPCKPQQKTEKSTQNVKIPDKFAKKGSNKEMLVFIMNRQETQDKKLDVLGEKVSKIEQKVEDYQERHRENENKQESTKQQSQSNLKWVIGIIISSSLGLAGLLWGILN